LPSCTRAWHFGILMYDFRPCGAALSLLRHLPFKPVTLASHPALRNSYVRF
jgi:hypothetical protein